MKVINEMVRGYDMPKRTGKVKGVVLHNDAGTLSAQEWHDTLVDAPLSRLEQGVAHYYIDRTTIWRAIDRDRVAWHSATADGNNNYISYEIVESMSASDKDFMANEQAVFKQAAEDLEFYKLPVTRDTVRIHMEFVATACPHRSMKLHTGFDPVASGRPSQDTIDELKDYFISQIKKYYNEDKNKELVRKDYNKDVSVSRGNIKVWIDFDFKKEASQKDVKLGSVFKAKYLYEHPNGQQYLSLYNSEGQWMGYFNKRDVIDVVGKPFNKKVTINKKNGILWADFYFKKVRGRTENLYNKQVDARLVYTLGNGRQYYSIYNDQGKWLGYLNKIDKK